MQLVLVFAPSTVAMLAAVGFRLFGAVVDEDGTVNHTLSISLVYPHHDPYLLQLYTGLCREAKR